MSTQNLIKKTFNNVEETVDKTAKAFGITKENAGEVGKELTKGGADIVQYDIELAKFLLFEAIDPRKWTGETFVKWLTPITFLLWACAMFIPFYNPHIFQYGFHFWMLFGLIPLAMISGYLYMSNTPPMTTAEPPINRLWMNRLAALIIIIVIVLTLLTQGYFVHTRAITAMSYCGKVVWAANYTALASTTENNSTLTSWSEPLLCFNDVKFNTYPRFWISWMFALFFHISLVVLGIACAFYAVNNVGEIENAALRLWNLTQQAVQQQKEGALYDSGTLGKKVRSTHKTHMGKDDPYVTDRHSFLRDGTKGKKEMLDKFADQLKSKYPKDHHYHGMFKADRKAIKLQ